MKSQKSQRDEFHTKLRESFAKFSKRMTPKRAAKIIGASGQEMNRLAATRWAVFDASGADFDATTALLLQSDAPKAAEGVAELVSLRKEASKSKSNRKAAEAAVDQLAVRALTNDAVQRVIAAIMPQAKVVGQTLLCPECSEAAAKHISHRTHRAHKTHPVGTCCAVNPITDERCGCEWRPEDMPSQPYVN